jgi:hypothetical protein
MATAARLRAERNSRDEQEREHAQDHDVSHY